MSPPHTSRREPWQSSKVGQNGVTTKKPLGLWPHDPGTETTTGRPPLTSKMMTMIGTWDTTLLHRLRKVQGGVRYDSAHHQEDDHGMLPNA
jgi:hypothetical protein